MNNLDFFMFHEPNYLGLDISRSFPYEPSPDRFLCKIMTQLPIRFSDRLLDVGCGKGYALFLFHRFPFEVTDGVEISPYLVKIARLNLQKLKIPAVIYLSDAAAFQNLDSYNYFYLANPFPENVMAEFLENLKLSMLRNSRTVTILYLNPVCDKMFRNIAQKIVQYEEKINGIRYGFFVYTIEQANNIP
jgi:SAM-dependent methyltransferase